MTDEFLLERRGALLVATMNRPDARNALNGALIQGIGRAIVDAENDPDLRAVVLTGSGDRTFCAGMDLKAFAGGGQGGFGDDEAASAAYRRLLTGEVTVPVVGAANGSAVGGGLELLLGCDLIVAADHAKFGLPEVKRGLFAAGGGWKIGTRIPTAIAMELALTGDPITATRAYEVGLVNRVVPAAEALTEAIGLAERIAANGPLAVSATKELVGLAITDLPRANERAAEHQKSVFASEDAKEGATAFMEKRDPVWKGR